MRIEFLGTGGAITTPQPLCSCRVCVEARTKGIPYSRSGPSLFVHGPDVLVDTPEEIKDQLNRSRVTNVAACLYSHWHPDHVMGRRVFEMNQDWTGWPPENQRTDVYVPEQVGKDFRRMLGTWDHLAYLEHRNLIRLVELSDGESVTLGEVRISPFRLAEEYVYAFLFEEGDRRALVAPDELNGWEPPETLRGVDLAVLPMGLAETHPLTGERRFAREHPILKMEATFDETLRIVEMLDPGRVIFTHVEEISGVTYDDLKTLEGRLRSEGLNVTFAFDTMITEF